MWWWIATIVVWLFSAGWIIGITVGVARGTSRAFSRDTIGGVVVHGVTAIAVLFLLFKALGA